MGQLEPALVFAGFMGAGKSSAAKSVAAELGVRAIDSDHEIERELGEPIDGWFERNGEAAFRDVEESVVLGLLERPDLRVLALGGGSLQSERVLEALRRHVVVFLDVDTDSAWHRASNGRPLARDRNRFAQLHEERRPVYERLADAWLPAVDRGTVRAALPALGALARAEARPRLIWAPAASGEYPVFFGHGLVASGFFYPQDRRRFVLTDENVARAHPFGGDWQQAIPPGERSKTPAQAASVTSAMAAAGVTRADILAAVGGGVVGDIGGFCAAVYQRGMPWVGVPTTLVAQVDSAFGGKTGVDLPEGKNYMGVYHQPSAVIVDPDTLRTLDSAERAAGYAEVVKTALIAGGRLWARVRRGGEVDDETILGCIQTKLSIVAEDERDAGRRQVLNLGHTVAHAIEAATGYGRYRHGEAVALGLLCALRLSERPQLRDSVERLLQDHGLPVKLDGVTPEDVVALLHRDKKRLGKHVPFVLVEQPGLVTPGHEIPQASVLAALEELT
ncbi:MAG: shikimate kinase / 3-dehydroquinate synthase [Thermoleophilaceae bacterium]|nr:shikimate kinase / 3-dehydroquinate synthase [Thermoleophilaceae bacterium]